MERTCSGRNHRFTQYAYQQRDGQAELALVTWLNTKTVYLERSSVSVLTELDKEENLLDVPNNATYH